MKKSIKVRGVTDLKKTELSDSRAGGCGIITSGFHGHCNSFYVRVDQFETVYFDRFFYG
ncbi:MAG: hypothetical protein GY765_10955 [bacterium]|nr:hypothetical protein [bacterium]